MPKGKRSYRGVEESGGIDSQKKPGRSMPFQAMSEDNITAPTRSAPKGAGRPAPGYPEVTKHEGG